MSESLSTYSAQPLPEAIEMLLMGGDLSPLSPEQRLMYYNAVCHSLGLNPLTKPFDFLQMDGKKGEEGRLVLYARKDCTEQLRSIRNISIQIVGEKTLNSGIYIVTAKATLPSGRTDEATGAVPLNKEDGQWKSSDKGKRYFETNGKMIPLTGDNLANAYMKAETKAKRRVTLSICGLGLLDESEIDSVAGAKRVPVDLRTGEIATTAEVLTLPESTKPITDSSDAAPSGRSSVEDVIDGPSKHTSMAGTTRAQEPAPESEKVTYCDDSQVKRLVDLANKKGWGEDDTDRLFADLLIPEPWKIPAKKFQQVWNKMMDMKYLGEIRGRRAA